MALRYSYSCSSSRLSLCYTATSATTVAASSSRFSAGPPSLIFFSNRTTTPLRRKRYHHNDNHLQLSTSLGLIVSPFAVASAARDEAVAVDANENRSGYVSDEDNLPGSRKPLDMDAFRDFYNDTLPDDDDKNKAGTGTAAAPKPSKPSLSNNGIEIKNYSGLRIR